MENEKIGVSIWDKVHAVGIFILGIAAIVMVGNPLIQRILPAAQPEPQPQQMISGYGLPPVQSAARGAGTNNTVVNNTVGSLPWGSDLSV